MDQSHLDFEERLQRVMRKHRSMTKGYSFRMRADGLMVAVPRRAVRPIPMRSLFMLVGSILLFKAFILAHIGPAGYADRLDILRQGSVVERAGAFVMQSDPATRHIAEVLRPILH